MKKVPTWQQKERKARAWTFELKSRLEERLVQQLDESGVTFTYEAQALRFTPPVKTTRKTFDFWITTRTGKLIVVEAKGWWKPKARIAELECIKQHPEFDVRYCFERASTKINKNSKTTYAMVCDKAGVQWATGGRIPDAWFDE
jgi:hypothetical protein